MPSVDESVSQWIEGLRAGDEPAAAKLWQRYYERLVRLACKKLGSTRRRAADEEDVALSAFQSFCQGAKENRFPSLHDRNDLWHLLVSITMHKASDQLRADRRKKRGSGKVAGESAFTNGDGLHSGDGIDGVAGPEPTPEFAAEMAETTERLLEMLDDEELRQIALMKLEGYRDKDVADRIGRSLPTVERRLRLIREIWEAERANE